MFNSSNFRYLPMEERESYEKTQVNVTLPCDITDETFDNPAAYGISSTATVKTWFSHQDESEEIWRNGELTKVDRGEVQAITYCRDEENEGLIWAPGSHPVTGDKVYVVLDMLTLGKPSWRKAQRPCRKLRKR